MRSFYFLHNNNILPKSEDDFDILISIECSPFISTYIINGDRYYVYKSTGDVEWNYDDTRLNIINKIGGITTTFTKVVDLNDIEIWAKCNELRNFKISDLLNQTY